MGFTIFFEEDNFVRLSSVSGLQGVQWHPSIIEEDLSRGCVRNWKLWVQKIKFHQFVVNLLNIHFNGFLWVQNSLSEKSVGVAAPTASTLAQPLLSSTHKYENFS